MQPFHAKCLIWEVLGLRFCMIFAILLNVFFMLLSVLAELGLQKGCLLGPFPQILQILHVKKAAEIEARKLLICGRLLGGASGSGEGLPESADSAKHSE